VAAEINLLAHYQRPAAPRCRRLQSRDVTTVVIPAHNEGRVIRRRRLLEQFINGADPGEMGIIVVADGCTDGTAGVAASFGLAA